MPLDGRATLPELAADPAHEAALWRRAEDLAGAYQVVLRCEEGRYYGWGLELPDAMNHGTTAEECVRATREVMARAVAKILRAGGTPPAPTLDVDRTARVELRVTPAERALLESGARAQGCRTVAEFARQVALDRAGLVGALPAATALPQGVKANAELGPVRRRRVARARALVAMMWAGALVATLAVLAGKVESVLVSGPVLLLGGLVLAVVASRARYESASLVGIAHCGIAVLVFAVVNIAEWGPRQARVPVAVIGVIYVIATLPLCVYALRSAPREVDPGVCAGCGYSLYGLDEPRCPECGMGFDPKVLLTFRPSAVQSGRGRAGHVGAGVP